jgi:hypothetical protein
MCKTLSHFIANVPKLLFRGKIYVLFKRKAVTLADNILHIIFYVFFFNFGTERLNSFRKNNYLYSMRTYTHFILILTLCDDLVFLDEKKICEIFVMIRTGC